jgi:membrane-associated phospholipid phosphatase
MNEPVDVVSALFLGVLLGIGFLLLFHKLGWLDKIQDWLDRRW